EQVTLRSVGPALARLQALLMTHGASAQVAQNTALRELAGQVQRQAFILAIQDAFTFTVITVAIAIIAVFFVRKSRRPTHIPEAVPATGRPVAAETGTEAEEAAPVPSFAE